MDFSKEFKEFELRVEHTLCNGNKYTHTVPGTAIIFLLLLFVKQAFCLLFFIF